MQTQFDPTATKVAVLVSNEFEGLTRNGGIGTYVTTLSNQLAADGWRVILLLTQCPQAYGGQSPWPQIAHVFSTADLEQVLTLSPLQQAQLAALQTSPRAQAFTLESYRVLFWIEAFSKVYVNAVIYVEFPEIWGVGYQTIAAKQAGYLGSHVLTAVMNHGSFEWLAEVGQEYRVATLERAQWHWQARQDEQWCSDHADVTFAPSAFLITKMAQYGWQTAQVKRLPYFVPCIELGSGGDTMGAIAGLRPVVFFGRLEERKGLRSFVAAVRSLPAGMRATIQVILMGKVGEVVSDEGVALNSQQYLARELSGVVRYDLWTELSSQAAIAALAALPHPIVCLTSRAENFPHTALEMSQLPVPLVVADTGGFRETLEWVERTEGVYWFAPDSVSALAAALTTAIQNQMAPTVPTRDRLLQINQTLLNHRLELMSEAWINAAPKPSVSPLVAVFVVGRAAHSDVGELLTQLTTQTYEPLDIWVAGTAEQIESDRGLFPPVQWLTVPLEQPLGVTGNQLVAKTTADYVLCLRPGMSLQPDSIETWVRATGCGEAAIVTSPLMVAHGEQIHQIVTVEGSLLHLLQQDYPYDLPMLCRRAWLVEFPYDETRGLAAIHGAVLAGAIATQQPIVHYPLPLLSLSPHAPTIPPHQWPQERFHLRQALFRIPAAHWSQRQVNLLLMGFEQLSQLHAPLPVEAIASLPPTSTTPQEQAWQLTAQQLHTELLQAHTQLQQQAHLKDVSVGQQWFEAQWQTWLLKAQREETQGALLKALTEQMYGSKFLRIRRGLRKLTAFLNQATPDPLQLPTYTYTHGVQEFITRLARQPLRYWVPEPQQQPIVSVISPAPTDICVVETTYRTIANQTLQAFDWLLLTNADTNPAITALLHDLEQRSPKIRVLKGMPGHGEPEGRAIAQGNYICYVNFGTLLDPTYLEKAAIVLALHPTLPAINSHSIVFQMQEHWWQTPLNTPRAVVEQMGLMSHPVYRRTALDAVTVPDGETHGLADWHRCLAVLAAGGPGYTIPEYLDGVRATPDTAPGLMTIVPPTVQRQLAQARSQYAATFSKTSTPLPIPLANLTTLSQPLPLRCSPMASPSARRILLLCDDLAVNDMAQWNRDLVLQLVDRSHQVTLVTTEPEKHLLGESCHAACPDQFHLANLGDRRHGFAILRYLITSRQINTCILSGSQWGAIALPALKAHWPQLPTLAYEHSKGSLSPTTVQTWQQLTPHLDYYCFATHDQYETYRAQAFSRAIANHCPDSRALLHLLQSLPLQSLPTAIKPSKPDLLLPLLNSPSPDPAPQPTPSQLAPNAADLSTKALLKLLLKKLSP